jgi:hypothetical protein
MLSGKFFRLDTPTLGIEETSGRRRAVTVPANEIVRVVQGPTPTATRLVDVMWEGRYLTMFTVDIQERGTEVEDHESAHRTATSSMV